MDQVGMYSLMGQCGKHACGRGLAGLKLLQAMGRQTHNQTPSVLLPPQNANPQTRANYG